MKNILAVVAIVIAITSPALSRTRYDAGKQVGNPEQMTGQIMPEPGRQLDAIGAGENIAQCNLTFITESFPDFPLGVPVNFQLAVCCGTPPYRFEIVQGTLPAGLHFNRNGRITGKPLEVADTTVFFKVTDSEGCSLTQAFQVRVVEP